MGAIAAIVLSKGHYLPITDWDRFTAAGVHDYLHRLQEDHLQSPCRYRVHPWSWLILAIDLS